jgi:hypothetical protein
MYMKADDLLHKIDSRLKDGEKSMSEEKRARIERYNDGYEE